MKNRFRTLAGACAAVLACTSAAAAQHASPPLTVVDTTTRVRFVAPTVISSREPVAGRVIAVNDTAMLVRWDRAPQDEPLLVPFHALTSLEQSQGRISSGTGRHRGMRTGLAVGAVLGFLGGFIYSGDEEVQKSLTKHQTLGAWGESVLASALVGGGIGAVIGSRGFERWKHVSWPHVAASQGRGTLVSMTVRPGSGR